MNPDATPKLCFVGCPHLFPEQLKDRTDKIGTGLKESGNKKVLIPTVLADVWVDGVSMPAVDCPGDEFLAYVKDGMKMTVKEDGIVEVE